MNQTTATICPHARSTNWQTRISKTLENLGGGGEFVVTVFDSRAKKDKKRSRGRETSKPNELYKNLKANPHISTWPLEPLIQFYNGQPTINTPFFPAWEELAANGAPEMLIQLTPPKFTEEDSRNECLPKERPTLPPLSSVVARNSHFRTTAFPVGRPASLRVATRPPRYMRPPQLLMRYAEMSSSPDRPTTSPPIPPGPLARHTPPTLGGSINRASPGHPHPLSAPRLRAESLPGPYAPPHALLKLRERPRKDMKFKGMVYGCERWPIVSAPPRVQHPVDAPLTLHRPAPVDGTLCEKTSAMMIALPERESSFCSKFDVVTPVSFETTMQARRARKEAPGPHGSKSEDTGCTEVLKIYLHVHVLHLVYVLHYQTTVVVGYKFTKGKRVAR
ncbi:hypothetical protein C2E23DRAFT_859673 [Lenzites betulinus]|nr:hypothetical protein C2E23DRAFT_859673 [Lenzites betulinus]